MLRGHLQSKEMPDQNFALITDMVLFPPLALLWHSLRSIQAFPAPAGCTQTLVLHNLVHWEIGDPSHTPWSSWKHVSAMSHLSYSSEEQLLQNIMNDRSWRKENTAKFMNKARQPKEMSLDWKLWGSLCYIVSKSKIQNIFNLRSIGPLSWLLENFL